MRVLCFGDSNTRGYIPGTFGLHFTPRGHRALAGAIAEKLNNMHRK